MDELIRLEHGSGGELSRRLVEEVIHPYVRCPASADLPDAARLDLAGPIALTTDSYVVDPLFFPGSDIGRLAVFGTCNDLAVSGARARALTLALVLEEGLPISVLRRVLASVKTAAAEAGVEVVTGDTKVIGRDTDGRRDRGVPTRDPGLYLNTAGVGEIVFEHLGPSLVRPGDRLIVSGPLGAHGVAVLGARENLSVAAGIRSDCALLWPLAERLFGLGPAVRFLRDATRGGLAAVSNELCRGMRFGITLRERDVPADPDVAVALDLLGLDALEVANEGVLVAVVAADAAEAAVALLRSHPTGCRAAIAGEITADGPGRVVLETRIGGRRLVDFPRGLLLPRIC
ncbi:MAG: hydrogenase expression/formation protein HypE [Spirochaetes bacterium]|nr:hydrogenase expression/formation protein HypE [Spirochaetota bacterium]